MMMCRFRDLDDPGYRKVKGVVTQYLDEIQTAQAQEGTQFDEASFQTFVTKH
jgi:predicted secreted Zn-dependent protease